MSWGRGLRAVRRLSDGQGGGGVTDPMTKMLALIQPSTTRYLLYDASNYDRALSSTGGISLSTAVADPAGGAEPVWLFSGGAEINIDGAAAFALGTGDGGLMAWVRWTDLTGMRWLVDYRVGTEAGSYPILYTSGTSLRFYHDGSDRITGSSTLATGAWRHVLWSRVAGVSRLFLDGVQEGSDYTDTAVSYLVGTNRPRFGRTGDQTVIFPGYMTGLVFLAPGSPHLKTAAFSPPTFPLQTLLTPS